MTERAIITYSQIGAGNYNLFPLIRLSLRTRIYLFLQHFSHLFLFAPHTENTTHAEFGPASHGDRHTWQMWRGAHEYKVRLRRYTKVTWTVTATRWRKKGKFRPKRGGVNCKGRDWRVEKIANVGIWF